MTNNNLIDKLDDIIEKKPSRWREEAAWRKANRNWLKKSAKIALLVLDRMDELGWNQNDLAKEMGTSQQYISKLCKGHENLTLKNIALLEEKLGIDLSIGEKANKSSNEYEFNNVIQFYFSSIKNNINYKYHLFDNYRININAFKLKQNEMVKQDLNYLYSIEKLEF